MTAQTILLLGFAILLGGCSAPLPKAPLRGHLQNQTPEASGSIPQIVERLAEPQDVAIPRQRLGSEKFSVTVHRVPVRDLLFALARDAGIDIDIAPGINGLITLNALEQPLPALLARIARQVPLRFELTADSLLILPDTPYLRHYPVDYVNLARTVNSAVSNNMQIGNTAGNTGNSIGAGSLSNTRIENTTQHRFWENLEKNLHDVLKEFSLLQKLIILLSKTLQKVAQLKLSF